MIWVILGFAVVLACVARVLLKPDRDPASRVAWLAVLFALPGVGVLAYALLGETNIGRKRALRASEVLTSLPRPRDLDGWKKVMFDADQSAPVNPLFRVAQSISGYDAVSGNSAALMADSDTAIDTMISDIDAAKRHVHLMFYIWLPDYNGVKMVEALKRAAARGVTVRAMVDDLGSRSLVRSKYWSEMSKAGVNLARVLKIGNPILRIFTGRIDLRNHRKILVVDNTVTYCGSQNCADPAFLPKAKFAPWVDAVLRIEGPVVRQNQHLFASDWVAETNEDISDVLTEPVGASGAGFPAVVIGTGPTGRHSAMPEMFTALIYSAKHRLVVTTPYFVPEAMVQAALCAAARRGVETTIIFPKRNDDFAVGATSKSYYADLLDAGVRVFEYIPGLLHTKSMVVDDEITLIGSANMDRRSFDLNYENNILLWDADTTSAMLQRQMDYLEDSEEVTLGQVLNWPWPKRLWNNALAVVGPIL